MTGNSARLSASAKAVDIIGVACAEGTGEKGSEFAADKLHSDGLVKRLQGCGVASSWRETIRPSRGWRPYPRHIVRNVCRRLADGVHQVVANGGLPLIIGGDHSCAIGTWKGVASAVRERGVPGLIWIDAHMDAHTPDTSPSGALHGMPLACLLGYGEQQLTALAGGVTLNPKRICLVGTRSYEASEAALLRDLGVRVYFMDDVERRGLAVVLREAVAAVKNEAGFGITIDLDALDPHDAPGVNTPVSGGMRDEVLAAALAGIAADPALLAVEIAEYNPERDRDGHTGRVVARLIDAMFDLRSKAADSRWLRETEFRYGSRH